MKKRIKVEIEFEKEFEYEASEDFIEEAVRVFLVQRWTDDIVREGASGGCLFRVSISECDPSDGFPQE